MRQEKRTTENVSLLEKSFATLTERVERIDAALKELEDLKRELRGIKLFIGRTHPEFKSQLPELMKKLKG